MYLLYEDASFPNAGRRSKKSISNEESRKLVSFL
jgi:hypothetical protein